jgi:XTP/dITP diphosphohydrolase
VRVVVATRNRGKLRELLPLLAASGLDFELVTIDELAPDAELREDELSFEGNALAKARQAAVATGLPALADDSGLEVDALDGAPGVFSARYAGEGATDAANNAKLLEALRGVPDERRAARYRCVAAFVDPSRGVQPSRGVDPSRGFEIWRAGVCEGRIGEAPRGDGGFGYDPLFLVSPAFTRTMAEVPLDEKNRISHRAAAFRALAAALTP